MTRSPLISCLMVTSGGPLRLPFLRRSIADFCRQTYKNRELVIVTDLMPDADFREIQAICRSTGRVDIRLVRPRRKLLLGGLRNLSVDHARGTIVCQWDDDDLYHPERLDVQHSALQQCGSGAVYLKDVLHFLEAYHALFWVRWNGPGVYCHTATIMAFKRDMPRYCEVGDVARSGEDQNVYWELRKKNHVSVIEQLPHLYAYVFHGSNTCAFQHHLATVRASVSERTIRRHKRQLCDQIRQLTLDHANVRLFAPTGPVGPVT